MISVFLFIHFSASFYSHCSILTQLDGIFYVSVVVLLVSKSLPALRLDAHMSIIRSGREKRLRCVCEVTETES